MTWIVLRSSLVTCKDTDSINPVSSQIQWLPKTQRCIMRKLESGDEWSCTYVTIFFRFQRKQKQKKRSKLSRYPMFVSSTNPSLLSSIRPLKLPALQNIPGQSTSEHNRIWKNAQSRHKRYYIIINVWYGIQKNINNNHKVSRKMHHISSQVHDMSISFIRVHLSMQHKINQNLLLGFKSVPRPAFWQGTERLLSRSRRRSVTSSLRFASHVVLPF